MLQLPSLSMPISNARTALSHLEILRIYNNDDFNIKLKDDASPLTQADTASHQILSQILADHFPTIPMLSEEGKNIQFEFRKHWREYSIIAEKK